jgi:hypothetical protein
MLSPYCADGAYEQYFEGDSNINFKKNFVVLELEALNAKAGLTNRRSFSLNETYY